jgi:macrolide transport system ATP-binding/permease protein
VVRKLGVKDELNFDVTKSDNLSALLIENLSFVSVAATLIAIITLIGAAIGLMNIMLVSVTERTREIGLRKAIGARNDDIMLQFLVESEGMTLIGGLVGIATGIGVSQLLSFVAGWAVKTSLFSVVLATLFSVVTGLFFGLWPARKAADLKPVDALRYE